MENNELKDLNLSMLKVVQENSAQAKRERARAVQAENQRLIENVVGVVSESEKQQIRQRLYQNSVQTPNKTRKQEIHGKTYADKNKVKNIIKVAVAVAGLVVVAKGAVVAEEIDYYNQVLDQKIESELTDKQATVYENDHDNFISNTIEAYQKIQQAKNSLNPEDYKLKEENITNYSNDYRPWDEDALINLSEQAQDAIDIATDDVISEYRRRG